MALDIARMREKYAKLTNKGGNTNESFWKPQDGTQVIRLVVPADGDPFRDLHFHYSLGANERTNLLCPQRNYGDDCPVCSFANQLWNGTDEEKNLARNYFAKMRVFAPVVVRGEEDKGIRLWGFSKTTYEKLLGIVLDPEYGDITDVHEGTDIRIDYGKAAGQSWPTTDVRPARKTTPLAETDEEISKLVATMPNFDDLFERKTTAQVAAVLEETLGTEATAEENSSETVKFGNGSDSAAKATETTSGAVTDIDDAFNELLS
jgi:hypothetical protein